jgi:putative N6-adenine-specific DNA methylase
VAKYFAVTAPGLKSLTAQELHELGIAVNSENGDAPAESAQYEVAGGIEFNGSVEDLYSANLNLRTANRVLVRLGSFYATSFAELRKMAARQPWDEYLSNGTPISLRVTCHKSKLYHSGAVAERIAGSLEDRLGGQFKIQPFNENQETDPPQLVVVRLVKDFCTISIDSSGEGLHRRGYRKATAKAPLRETLAAAMLLASRWDRQSPLLDPFCGSGTIPIEAALLAQQVAPGSLRRFAFMDWPSFNPQKWEGVLKKSAANQIKTGPIIHASDRDAGAVKIAQENAMRAGVGDQIEFSHRAISAIEPQGQGWVVTNPPYGQRVSGSKDLRNLYAQIGHVLRRTCPGWKVAIMSSHDMLLGMTGLAFEQKISMVNGGINVKVALGEVV